MHLINLKLYMHYFDIVYLYVYTVLNKYHVSYIVKSKYLIKCVKVLQFLNVFINR